jgi:hypothetical protein
MEGVGLFHSWKLGLVFYLRIVHIFSPFLGVFRTFRDSWLKASFSKKKPAIGKLYKKFVFSPFLGVNPHFSPLLRSDVDWLKTASQFPFILLFRNRRLFHCLCAICPGKSRALDPLDPPTLLALMDAPDAFFVVCFLSAGLAEECPFIVSLHISPPFKSGKACRVFRPFLLL